MEEVIVNGMPESLRRYIVDDCSIPPSSFKLMPGDQLPEPARQLMFHDGDMTSTLAMALDSPIGKRSSPFCMGILAKAIRSLRFSTLHLHATEQR